MDLSSREGDIPIPITSTYVGGGGGGGGGGGHGTPPTIHRQNGPPPPPPPHSLSTTEEPHNNNHNNSSSIVPYTGKKTAAAVKYRECLKNHAASIGGSATDGCGEFMPSGDEGTLEALKCSACGCHRNFHRREFDGGDSISCDWYGRKLVGHVVSSPHQQHQMVMPIGALQPSDSESAKKRFRTKFTPEQKERMLAFAERVGWRLQRQEEGVVQQLCQEIGVKRRVLKVWIHNNKHNLAKRNNNTTTTTTTTLSSSSLSLSPSLPPSSVVSVGKFA